MLALLLVACGREVADSDREPLEPVPVDPRFEAAPWDEPFPATGGCGALLDPLSIVAAEDLEAAVWFATMGDLLYDGPFAIAERDAACPTPTYGEGLTANGTCDTASGWRWEGFVSGWPWSEDTREWDLRVRYDDPVDGRVDARAFGEEVRDGEIIVRDVSVGFLGTGDFALSSAPQGWFTIRSAIVQRGWQPEEVSLYAYSADDGSGRPTGDLCVAGELVWSDCYFEGTGVLTVDAAVDATITFDGSEQCDGCGKVEMAGEFLGLVCGYRPPEYR